MRTKSRSPIWMPQMTAATPGGEEAAAPDGQVPHALAART